MRSVDDPRNLDSCDFVYNNKSPVRMRESRRRWPLWGCCHCRISLSMNTRINNYLQEWPPHDAEGDDLRNWIQMWPLDNSRVDYEDLSVWEGQVLLIHINYPQANEFQTVTWAIIVSWETIKFKYTALLRPRELLMIFQIEEELPTKDYWLPNDKYWGGKSRCEAEIVGTAEILDNVGISVSGGKDSATLYQPATGSWLVLRPARPVVDLSQ